MLGGKHPLPNFILLILLNLPKEQDSRNLIGFALAENPLD